MPARVTALARQLPGSATPATTATVWSQKIGELWEHGRPRGAATDETGTASFSGVSRYLNACRRNGLSRLKGENTARWTCRFFASGKKKAGCYLRIKRGARRRILGYKPLRSPGFSILSSCRMTSWPRNHVRVAPSQRYSAKHFGFIARVSFNSYVSPWSLLFRRSVRSWPAPCSIRPRQWVLICELSWREVS